METVFLNLGDFAFAIVEGEGSEPPRVGTNFRPSESPGGRLQSRRRQ